MEDVMAASNVLHGAPSVAGRASSATGRARIRFQSGFGRDAGPASGEPAWPAPFRILRHHGIPNRRPSRRSAGTSRIYFGLFGSRAKAHSPYQGFEIRSDENSSTAPPRIVVFTEPSAPADTGSDAGRQATQPAARLPRCEFYVRGDLTKSMSAKDARTAGLLLDSACAEPVKTRNLDARLFLCSVLTSSRDSMKGCRTAGDTNP
jgi:hypothetical protein